MRMGFGLNLEQTQKLIMTPELRQAITILQLSSLELEDYLQEQIVENPVLEMKEESREKEEEPEKAEEESFDVDWQDYFADKSDIGYIRAPMGEKPEYSYENFLTEAPSLREHLELQLQLSATKRQQKIGSELIGNIDEQGYLRVQVEDVVEKLKLPAAEVEEVLRLIQTFDPNGVGARDLKECLLIQLRQLSPRDFEAERIATNYLPELANGRLSKIAKAMGILVQEVQRSVDIIKRLDPKPGRKFGSSQDVRYVIPDVTVEKLDGEYIILVNDSRGARLGINPLYQNLILNKDACDHKTRKFVENKLNAAAWVLKSIEQRRLTIYKVARCIIEHQQQFLEQGVKYLKPLNLKQVAESVDLHESTVSRATANKYIQTPLGVFELKFFFASGLADNHGGQISADSIRKQLEEYIDSENKSKPWTDQQITDFLNKQGIKISRRTVAKYRDELGVPSAIKRKRY